MRSNGLWIYFKQRSSNMIRQILFYLSFIIIWSCQSAVKPSPTSPKSVPQKKEVSLVHLVRQPNPQVASPPLLIILHGVGANERNLHEPLAPYFDPRFLVVSVRSPIELGPDRFGWYQVGFSETGVIIDPKEEDAGREKLLEVIDEIVQYYEVDASKVFLLGFSQGAIMSSAAVLSAPEKIRGAVLLSGKTPMAIDQHLASKSAIQKVAVFMSHGRNDKVLPITDGQQLKEKLEKAGVKNLIYKEHNGAHQLDGQHIREVISWLSSLL